MRNRFNLSISTFLSIILLCVAGANAQATASVKTEPSKNDSSGSTTGTAADVKAIRAIIARYEKVVDTTDANELAQLFSHADDVTFIYPLGEERGFAAIEKHVFEDVMRGMFSARDLHLDPAEIHVNGNSAWSEYHWTFHATMRKDGSAVTTHGVETQIYRKEHGAWRIVHVHYSADPTPATTP